MFACMNGVIPVSVTKKTPAAKAYRVRRESSESDYFRGFASPRAFFIFWTLGSEMPTSLAISSPVLPASASFLTAARVASVITDRFRRFLAPPPPDFEAGRPRLPEEAALRASTNSASEP